MRQLVTFLRNLHSFPEWLHHSHFHQGSFFSTSSPTLVIFVFLVIAIVTSVR